MELEDAMLAATRYRIENDVSQHSRPLMQGGIKPSAPENRGFTRIDICGIFMYTVFVCE